MRPPATIRDWLSIDRMFQWLQEAPDEASHRRRMAIWLTHTGRLHAAKVAEILGVSQSLQREFTLSEPDLLKRMQGYLPGVPMKSGRWVGEMKRSPRPSSRLG